MKTGGRAVKTETARHVLCGLVAGKRVNLKRLQSEMKSYPIREKWCDLGVAASALSPPLDILRLQMGRREPSIQFGARKNCCVGLMEEGSITMNTPYSERPEADRRTISRWYTAADWWASLQRAGVGITWQLPSESRRRVCTTARRRVCLLQIPGTVERRQRAVSATSVFIFILRFCDTYRIICLR